MIGKMLAAAGIAAALLLLCWWLRGAFLSPVRPGKHVRLRLLVTVSGRAPALEQTVDALLWLRANGTLPAEICIVDHGMDPETAEIAAALSKSGRITIID